LNEPLIKDAGAGDSTKAGRQTQKKKKGNFESEAATFVHNFKHALKDIHDMSHFVKI